MRVIMHVHVHVTEIPVMCVLYYIQSCIRQEREREREREGGGRGRETERETDRDSIPVDGPHGMNNVRQS